MCIAFSLLVSSVPLTVCVVSPNFVSSIFTDDPDTIFYIKSVLHLIVAFQLLDTVRGVLAGIIRALGSQALAGFVSLLCYYALGMPLALYLGFKREMDLYGFWEGFLIAMVILDIATAIICFCSDWDHIKHSKAKEARDLATQKLKGIDEEDN